MQTINLQELITKSEGYKRKQVEVSYESEDTPLIVNNYKEFYLYEGYDYTDEKDILILQDGTEAIQRIYIGQNDIDYIVYHDGINTYESVFDLYLKHGKLSFCISESPIKCCLCNKIINSDMDTVWNISGVGYYGSHFDGEKLDINFCDDCLYTLLYDKGGIKQ